jgi:adenine-specific DNA-methyltransferase
VSASPATQLEIGSPAEPNTAKRLFLSNLRAAQERATSLPMAERHRFAESLTFGVLAGLWQRATRSQRVRWVLRPPTYPLPKADDPTVPKLTAALSALPPDQASFLVGQLYTALLPKETRRKFGAYYTPPSLASRLLHLVDRSGLDWSKARVVDPACGGAAFLVSVAAKLLSASLAQTPLRKLEDLEARLTGFELDPFAAWISMALLDGALLDLTMSAGRPLHPIVTVCDALHFPPQHSGQFDLVVGNPPYGKITLSRETRTKFSDSLFGHANSYGLFTALAIQLAREGGLIAYVAPTSFLSGEYFKKLRSLLIRQAPPERLDFVSCREGTFDGVLQETLLAVFRRRPDATTSPPVSDATLEVDLNVLHVEETWQPARVESVGRVPLMTRPESPWHLPRRQGQVELVYRSSSMPFRLADYGFEIATGQLVWNRHKDQLRAELEPECYPILWAEAVRGEGQFAFQARRRGHLPYLKLKPGQAWLLNDKPCLLVQRTTAKEQKRRLIAAVIPDGFVLKYPAFLVENHLNMICASTPQPRVSLATLAALLNSDVLDEVLRCLNGSVAVSAYELASLPLPSPELMDCLQQRLRSGASKKEVEKQIASSYEVTLPSR